jgi:probable HAF family extracellular repeat protein
MKQTHRVLVFGLVGAILLASAAVFLRCRPPALYTVTVLPALNGARPSALALNDRGQIAGGVPSPDGQYRLVLWSREAGTRDLGPVHRNCLAINGAGQIVGVMPDPNGRGQAFLWDPKSGRRLLGMLGGMHSEANAINNLSRVVGTVEVSAGVYRAFLWDQAHGMRDLGPGRARLINDAGQIVLYTPTGVVLRDANQGGADTGTLIPGRGIVGLNRDGCIVGYPLASAGRQEPVMWRPGSRAAESLGLGNTAGICAINDVNQVLFAREQPARFRVWGRTLLPRRIRWYLRDSTRGLISLDRYLPLGSGEEFYPTGLNNRGDIVGVMLRSLKDMTRGRAVLLEPVPERWKK